MSLLCGRKPEYPEENLLLWGKSVRVATALLCCRASDRMPASRQPLSMEPLTSVWPRFLMCSMYSPVVFYCFTVWWVPCDPLKIIRCLPRWEPHHMCWEHTQLLWHYQLLHWCKNQPSCPYTNYPIQRHSGAGSWHTMRGKIDPGQVAWPLQSRANQHQFSSLSKSLAPFCTYLVFFCHFSQRTRWCPLKGQIQITASISAAISCHLTLASFLSPANPTESKGGEIASQEIL